MKSVTMLVAALLAATLAGCASAPQPAACRGEFRPVNHDARLASLAPGERLALCTGERHGQS